MLGNLANCTHSSLTLIRTMEVVGGKRNGNVCRILIGKYEIQDLLNSQILEKFKL
jgi:hypothetical protein